MTCNASCGGGTSKTGAPESSQYSVYGTRRIVRRPRLLQILCEYAPVASTLNSWNEKKKHKSSHNFIKLSEIIQSKKSYFSDSNFDFVNQAYLEFMFLGNINTSLHKLFSKSSPSSFLRYGDDSALKNTVYSEGIKQM